MGHRPSCVPVNERKLRRTRPSGPIGQRSGLKAAMRRQIGRAVCVHLRARNALEPSICGCPDWGLVERCP
eukprot:3040040-Prymnesium_polylepis.1